MGACPPVGYVPRPTATSDLRRIVAAHLPAFVERIEHDGGTLPGFVTAELEGVLRCGDFEHGFLRLCCTRCGDELRVPFSCKARGICPSCIGRRMCETAANWLEHLLPEVPYRQWVLSFDSSLAVRLGYDARALGLCCRSFARRVAQKLRHRPPVATSPRAPGLFLSTPPTRRPRLPEFVYEPPMPASMRSRSSHIATDCASVASSRHVAPADTSIASATAMSGDVHASTNAASRNGTPL